MRDKWAEWPLSLSQAAWLTVGEVANFASECLLFAALGWGLTCASAARALQSRRRERIAAQFGQYPLHVGEVFSRISWRNVYKVRLLGAKNNLYSYGSRRNQQRRSIKKIESTGFFPLAAGSNNSFFIKNAMRTASVIIILMALLVKVERTRA